jgi:hypothetical protein
MHCAWRHESQNAHKPRIGNGGGETRAHGEGKLLSAAAGKGREPPQLQQQHRTRSPNVINNVGDKPNAVTNTTAATTTATPRKSQGTQTPTAHQRRQRSGNTYSYSIAPSTRVTRASVERQPKNTRVSLHLFLSGGVLGRLLQLVCTAADSSPALHGAGTPSGIRRWCNRTAKQKMLQSAAERNLWHHGGAGDRMWTAAQEGRAGDLQEDICLAKMQLEVTAHTRDAHHKTPFGVGATSALWVAAYAEAVRVLVKAGVDVNNYPPSGSNRKPWGNPLWIAARSGSATAARVLLLAKASVGASYMGIPAMVSERPPRVSTRGGCGAQRRCAKPIRCSFSRKRAQTFDTVDQEGHTPSYLVVPKGHNGALEVLIRARRQAWSRRGDPRVHGG